MIRVAVLGAGRIGKIHAGNVAKNPKCKLVAIADPIGDAAEKLAHSLGAEAAKDSAATAERKDVDAIIIGTPTDTHIDLLLKSARSGKAEWRLDDTSDKASSASPRTKDDAVSSLASSINFRTTCVFTTRRIAR